jgi:hypothetical protein
MNKWEKPIRSRWLYATGVMWILVGVLAGQPATAVFDFEPIGVDSTQTQILGILLRDRLIDTRAFRILVPTKGTKCYTQALAESLGSAMGAQKAVIGNVMKVGGRLLVSYKLLDLAQRTVEYSDRASVESETQMEIVTERIAQSIRDKQPYAQTPEAVRASQTGVKEVTPKEPMSSVLFTTGYAFPIAGSAALTKAGMLFNLDAAISYEMPDMFTLAQMGIRTAGDMRDVHFELLAHKFGSTKDIAPFYGGGFGVHRIWAEGKSTGGLSVSANAGMLFFRSYYFRIISNVKGSLLVTRDLGIAPMVAVNFGLTSPGMGPGGRIQTPPACIYGMVGTFFVIGLIAALTS